MQMNERLLLKIMAEGPMSIREIADYMSRGRKAPVSDELVRVLMSQLRRRGYLIQKRMLYRLADRSDFEPDEKERKRPSASGVNAMPV